MSKELLTWEKYWNYLHIKKGYKNSKKNVYSLKSRFKDVVRYFENKELNEENILAFFSLKRSGSASNYNKLITTIKNIGEILGVDKSITDIRYIKEPINPKDVLSVEEIEKLANVELKYGKKTDFISKRQKALILLMGINGGCRGGEAFKLEWTDLYSGDIPYVIFRETKNGDNRRVPLSPLVYELINNLPRSSKYIFTTVRNGQLDNQQVNLDLKTRALKCNIKKKISCHTFRHSYITNRTNDPFLNPTDLAIITGQGLDVIMRYKHSSLESTYSTIMSHPTFKKYIPNDDTFKKIEDYISRVVDTSNLNTRIDQKNGSLRIIINPISKGSR